MNREERRKAARKINTPKKLEEVLRYNIEEVERKKEEENRKNRMQYIEIILVMTAYTLSIEGYGKKRLPKLIERIKNNIDAFRTGHLEVSDYDIIKKELEEKGVQI